MEEYFKAAQEMAPEVTEEEIQSPEEAPETEAPITPENETPAPEETPEPENTPEVGETFFAKFNTEFGTEFKGEEDFFANYRELNTKASAEPPKPDYGNEFSANLAEFSGTLSDLTPEEAQGKLMEYVQSQFTDWNKVAQSQPEKLIFDQMKRDNPLLDEEEVRLLFEEDYKVPERNPDLEDGETDPAYDRAVKLRGAKIKRAAQEAAGKLESAKKSMRLGKDPEKVQAEQAAQAQKLEGYKSSANEILSKGVSIKVGDFDFAVRTTENGSLTQEGKFIQGLLDNPNQITNMLVKDGMWDAAAVAKAGYILANLDRITGARAQEIAAKEIEKNLAEARGTTGAAPDGGGRREINVNPSQVSVFT